jgi:hypothetical protein
MRKYVTMAAEGLIQAVYHPPPSHEPIPVIGERLLLGSVPLSSVPLSCHPELLSFFQVTKSEARLAGKMDLARQCQRFIEDLHVSDVTPDHPVIRARTALSQSYHGSRLPSISSYSDRSGSRESTVLKTQSDLEVANRFWDLELLRFNEDRQSATRTLLERHKNEINTLSHADLLVPLEETPAARALRLKKESAANEEEAQNVLSRAARIDDMERAYRQWRRKLELSDRLKELKARQLEERGQFERAWNERQMRLKSEMIAELEEKSRAVQRSGLNSNATPTRNQRVLFRRSCPVSILASIQRNG